MPSDEQRFKRDLVVPGLGVDVAPTLAGDWPTVAGTANLRGAALRRIQTSPGEMTHRQDYGAGLAAQIERPSTAVARSLLTASILDNLRRDSRIETVEVDIQDGTTPERSLVDVRVFAPGETSPVTTGTEVLT